MIISYNKRCFLTIRLVVLVVFLTTFLALMAGCSSFSAIKNTTKRIRRNFKAPDSGLKKKIGIAVFENKTSIVDPKLDDIFFNTLVAGLNQSCSDLIMVKPGDPDSPEFLTDLPKQTSGVIDNFRLSKAGKQFGLNAMITST